MARSYDILQWAERLNTEAKFIPPFGASHVEPNYDGRPPYDPISNIALAAPGMLKIHESVNKRAASAPTLEPSAFKSRCRNRRRSAASMSWSEHPSFSTPWATSSAPIGTMHSTYSGSHVWPKRGSADWAGPKEDKMSLTLVPVPECLTGRGHPDALQFQGRRADEASVLARKAASQTIYPTQTGPLPSLAASAPFLELSSYRGRGSQAQMTVGGARYALR